MVIELTNISKQKLKLSHSYGSNTPLFYIFDDGTLDKKIIIE